MARNNQRGGDSYRPEYDNERSDSPKDENRRQDMRQERRDEHNRIRAGRGGRGRGRGRGGRRRGRGRSRQGNGDGARSGRQWRPIDSDRGGSGKRSGDDGGRGRRDRKQIHGGPGDREGLHESGHELSRGSGSIRGSGTHGGSGIREPQDQGDRDHSSTERASTREGHGIGGLSGYSATVQAPNTAYASNTAHAPQTDKEADSLLSPTIPERDRSVPHESPVSTLQKSRKSKVASEGNVPTANNDNSSAALSPEDGDEIVAELDSGFKLSPLKPLSLQEQRQSENLMNRMTKEREWDLQREIELSQQDFSVNDTDKNQNEEKTEESTIPDDFHPDWAGAHNR